MDREPHQRRSLRLRGYDYSQAGAYFITICTQARRPVLGERMAGALQLTPAGLMVRQPGRPCRTPMVSRPTPLW